MYMPNDVYMFRKKSTCNWKMFRLDKSNNSNGKTVIFV